MNDQAYNFQRSADLQPVDLDGENRNAVFDKSLCPLFPDNKLGVLMPRQSWESSYDDLDLSAAQITLDHPNNQILVRGFNAAGEFKEQIEIPLCEQNEIKGNAVPVQRDAENLRFQIQYALGQLGALTLANGKTSGGTKPFINHFNL